MQALRRGIAVAAVAIALAITMTACGGGSGDGSSGDGGSSGGEKTEYANAQYGFTLMYSEPLSVVTLTPSNGEEYAIAFADKDGPVVDDQYVNGMRVSVHPIGRKVKAKDVPKLQADLQTAISKMVADIPGGKMIGDVTPLELNGTPGYSVDYQFTQGGEQLTCRLYILIKGENEFDLTTQTVSADWDSMQGTLEETARSFTLD
jgi:hypothetical protein